MGKYNNPIGKPEMVTIPRWEYARLIEAKTTLSLLRLQVENDKGYDATTLLKLMIDSENKMEG
jgi:hypothetical protein